MLLKVGIQSLVFAVSGEKYRQKLYEVHDLSDYG